MEKPEERKLLSKVLDILVTDMRADAPSRAPESPRLRVSKCRAKSGPDINPQE